MLEVGEANMVSAMHAAARMALRIRFLLTRRDAARERVSSFAGAVLPRNFGRAGTCPVVDGSDGKRRPQSQRGRFSGYASRIARTVSRRTQHTDVAP